MPLPNFKKIEDKGTSKSVRRQALKHIDKKWASRKVALTNKSK